MVFSTMFPSPCGEKVICTSNPNSPWHGKPYECPSPCGEKVICTTLMKICQSFPRLCPSPCGEKVICTNWYTFNVAWRVLVSVPLRGKGYLHLVNFTQASLRLRTCVRPLAGKRLSARRSLRWADRSIGEVSVPLRGKGYLHSSEKLSCERPFCVRPLAGKRLSAQQIR